MSAHEDATPTTAQPSPAAKTAAPQPPSGEPLLQVWELAAGYGDLRVVRDVSLELRPGELTVLLGRNGAGKTTTLRALAGLNKATAGGIRLAGEDITRAAPHARVRRGMAYVQEGKRVFHALTVEENLVMGGYTRRMRKAALRREAERVYTLFPALGERRTAVAGSLSGGQQQMLALGQALMAEPKLLLLDEPSGGLAPVVVDEVLARIGELKETGLAILLVEQAVAAALEVADRVAVLDRGRVVLSATAAEVGDAGALQEAYFGRVAPGD